MTCLLSVLLAVFFAAPAPPPPAPAPDPAPPHASPRTQLPGAASEAMMLRLRDGRILWGSIAAHDEEVLTFERLDTGGRVHLPWEMLDPELDRELRLARGYIDPEGEEILVTAESIPVRGGEEVVGIVVHRTADALWVKNAGGTLPVPLTRVAGPSTAVQVPALEVYTRDELYRRKRTELGDALHGEDAAAAEAHFSLGSFCERILDFQHALAHYETGAVLAPDLRPRETATALARLSEKAAHQEQWEYLKEADLMRARRYYARALERLAVFPELYPDSPILADWERLRAKTLKGQERALREEVVRRWHHWVERLAHDAARELGYEATLDWVEGSLSGEVLAAVQEDLTEIAPDIDEGAVRRLWEARGRGRIRKASYGHGTWLLGEDRAHADLEDDEELEETSETERLRSDLRERMQRYVESQRMAAQRRQRSESERPDEFWQRFPVHSRRQWIVAYYAEFGGDMRIARVRKSNCRECGGTGAKEVLYLGSARTQESRNRTASSRHQIVVCETCRHVGIVRRLQYR